MESLMKPVTLGQDVAKVLDEIRAGAENALYCAKPDVSEELFAKHIVSLVEGADRPRPRVPPRALHPEVGRARTRTEDAPVPRLRVPRALEGEGTHHKDTKSPRGDRNRQDRQGCQGSGH
jgi:hypothetical protein